MVARGCGYGRVGGGRVGGGRVGGGRVGGGRMFGCFMSKPLRKHPAIDGRRIIFESNILEMKANGTNKIPCTQGWLWEVLNFCEPWRMNLKNSDFSDR